MDSITITAAEHATYVAAMAEVETLRAKLATCREYFYHDITSCKYGDTVKKYDAAKEACK